MSDQAEALAARHVGPPCRRHCRLRLSMQALVTRWNRSARRVFVKPSILIRSC